jgi:aminopeptidase
LRPQVSAIAEQQRLTRLAGLAVHGANVQEGQIVRIGAEVGVEQQARATAVAACRRCAKFVDVDYFDPHLKRARIENADPDTLGFGPQWHGERVRQNADQNGASIWLRGVTAPNLMDGLTKSLVGEDILPRVKEVSKVVVERSINWCVVPAPHPAWATLVHPSLPADEAYEQLWREREHVLRLDLPAPLAAWDERMAGLNYYAARLAGRRFDAIELRAGQATNLTIGLLPTATWAAADLSTAKGLRHLPNLPTEEVFTTPDLLRTSGCVTATNPLVLRDGTIIRGLRVRFENGVAVEIDADENAETLRSLTEIDDSARCLGELALVDGEGRIGPLDTVFYSTPLDENVSSHIALGTGFPFLVERTDRERVNQSAQDIDFMIGSAELEVEASPRTANGFRCSGTSTASFNSPMPRIKLTGNLGVRGSDREPRHPDKTADPVGTSVSRRTHASPLCGRSARCCRVLSGEFRRVVADGAIETIFIVGKVANRTSATATRMSRLSWTTHNVTFKQRVLASLAAQMSAARPKTMFFYLRGSITAKSQMASHDISYRPPNIAT